MKGSRQELKVDGAAELSHVIGYLEQLVQALKSGSAEVRQGDRSIVLGPRGVVGFSLRAVDRGRRQRLALELEWRKFKAPAAELDLSIGAAPEPAPEPAADPASVYAAGAGNPYAEMAAAEAAESADPAEAAEVAEAEAELGEVD